MIDLLKKSIFLGLGLFEEGREKVEALVDDLINAGEVAKEERAKTIDKYVQKLREQEKIISEKINNEIKKTIEKFGIPTREDFEKLVKEIEALKKKIGQR